MRDGAGRELSYLRVSVTDRCNLRCGYCMPEEGVQAMAHEEVLRFDEIERVVRLMARLGVWRVRLTGGEPLVRRGIADLAREIKGIEGIRFLGLTTNGVLLEEMAGPLLAAGVDGLNISLDTTDPARYAALTRRDAYDKVRRGLNAALALPFTAVKLNCVLSPESRPEDWLGVVELAKTLPVDVRLIEWMPMAGEGESRAVPADEALAMIERRFGRLAPAGETAGGGPAAHYTLPGFAGRVGMISAISHQFCAGCNRLRLAADGMLRLCLFYGSGLQLKPMLRGGASDEEMMAAIEEAVQSKPLRHAGRVLEDEGQGFDTPAERFCGMYSIGG